MMKPEKTKKEYHPFTTAVVTFVDFRRSQDKPAGAVIALRAGSKQGVEWEENVGPWGAWRAYFKKIGYKQMVGLMDRMGTMPNFCLSVPMLWPHEYDMEKATVQGDHEAAERFRRGYRPPRLDLADAVTRSVTVKGYRAGHSPAADWSKAPSGYQERPKYNPFPALSEAFADKPELLEGRSFDALMAAAGLLAKYGKTAALEHLKAS